MDGETRGDRSEAQNTNQNSCCNNISGGIITFLIVVTVDDDASDTFCEISRWDIHGTSTYTSWTRFLTTNTILIPHGFP